MADACDMAKKSTADLGDLVTFNSQAPAPAGARGLVVERPGTPAGKLAVLRVDGSVVHADPDDLTVVDRPFFQPGKTVAWASDPGGMAGVVTAVDAVVDLADSDSVKAAAAAAPVVVSSSGVPQSRLRGVTELAEGDFVTSGPWLGRGVDVCVDVDVRFDDDDGGAAVCRVASVTKKHPSGMRPDPYCESLFYPGQHVAVEDAAAFQAGARWLAGGEWRSAYAERGGTVAAVELTDALVFWVASRRLGGGDRRLELVKAAAPPPQQRARDLAFFRSDILWFWGVGDLCFLRDAAAADEPVPMSVVVDTRTAVDVLWQDGTRSHGVPSPSLVHFDSHGEEFFPGQRVVSLDDDDDAVEDGSTAAAPPRGGIVRCVDWKEKTVRVSWLSSRSPVPAGGEEEEEEEEASPVVEETTVVSAYDVTVDYDHDAFYGDIVVRVAGGDEEAVADGDAAGDDLSWVGEVIDVSDSHALVKWGDGTTSKVLPHEVEIVETYSILNHIDALNNKATEDRAAEEEPAATTVTVTGNENDGGEGNGGGDNGSANDVIDNNASVHGLAPANLVQAASEMMKTVDDDDVAADWVVVDPASCGEGDVYGDSHGSTKKKAAGDTGDDLLHFPQFDVITQCPPDHHFFLQHEKEQGTSDDVKEWTQRVHKEWEILQNNLPDTIYVRAFEDRKDLLRAAIVGGAGTPYHDGLFIFDIHLPPSYPSAPPLVHYHSFGLWPLNPNLEYTGALCLSLVDLDAATTGSFGSGGEHWSPASSSVLQLVVALQGILQTAQPYFDKPDHAFQRGTPQGARNAAAYAENAFALTLRTMLRLPAGFEALVAGHFRRRGQFVLRACEAYLQGCPVGTLDADARAAAAVVEEGGGRRPCCSAGLRLALNGVVPRLVKAFAEIGADGCEEFGRLRLPLVAGGGGGDVAPPRCIYL